MPIIAKGNSSSFIPCPAGLQHAVCCDVIDKGLMDGPYGKKWKVDLRWQTAEPMNDGRPYLVQRRFTLSLHEKSSLRAFLESWRGKSFTEDELEGFDLEKLIGVNCMLNVVHKQGSKGGTFANAVSITPVMRGLDKLLVSADYVREQDRPHNPEPNEVPDDREYEADATPF